MSALKKTFKKDLDTFDYDSRDLLQDHKWDRLADPDEVQKFFDAKERIYMSRVKRNRVQSNPETTGQHSPID